MFYNSAKRVVIFVVGMTVLLIGVALIVLPGPAFIVIPAGLAILATEFAWAKRFLSSAKRKFQDMTGSGKDRQASPQTPEETL